MELTKFHCFNLAGVPVILFGFKPGFRYRSHETEIDFHSDTRSDLLTLTGKHLDEEWRVWTHEDRVLEGFKHRKEIEWRYLLVHTPNYHSFLIPGFGRDDSSDIIDRLLNFTFVTWQRPFPMDIEKHILRNRIDHQYRILEGVMRMLYQTRNDEEKGANQQEVAPPAEAGAEPLADKIDPED